MAVAGKLAARVFSLMIIFSFATIHVSQAQAGGSLKTFMPVLTIPKGKKTCAMDEPSKVVKLSGVGGFADVAQCSMQCTGDADCSGYNLKVEEKLCETYSYMPTRFAVVPGCEHRQVYPVQSEYLAADDVLKVADPSFVETCQSHAVSRYYNCDINTGSETEVTDDRTWLTCPTYIDMFDPRAPPPPYGRPCWILVQQNLDDGTSDFFKRYWKSYRLGSGDAAGNFWAGNEFLHQMTQVFNSGCRLRVELKEVEGEWLRAVYTNITVESEVNKYSLHVTGYYGNAGDVFADSTYPTNIDSDGGIGGQQQQQYQRPRGIPFSTLDFDNDQAAAANCAAKKGGGWWFTTCSHSALNGPKIRITENRVVRSFVASRMMINCGELIQSVE